MEPVKEPLSCFSIEWVDFIFGHQGDHSACNQMTSKKRRKKKGASFHNSPLMFNGDLSFCDITTSPKSIPIQRHKMSAKCIQLCILYKIQKKSGLCLGQFFAFGWLCKYQASASIQRNNKQEPRCDKARHSLVPCLQKMVGQEGGDNLQPNRGSL